MKLAASYEKTISGFTWTAITKITLESIATITSGIGSY